MTESEKKESPVAVEKYLKGIEFPASKEDIIHQAEDNEAPNNIIDVLSKIEDKEYGSPVEVAQEVGQVG